MMVMMIMMEDKIVQGEQSDWGNINKRKERERK
jgi:hypothetical protein